MFSCEYSEILENTYFEEHMCTAASESIGGLSKRPVFLVNQLPNKDIFIQITCIIRRII